MLPPPDVANVRLSGENARGQVSPGVRRTARVGHSDSQDDGSQGPTITAIASSNPIIPLRRARGLRPRRREVDDQVGRTDRVGMPEIVPDGPNLYHLSEDVTWR